MWKIQIIHSGVNCIHFALEFSILFVKFRNVQSHVTNNQTIHNRAQDQNRYCQENLAACSWTDFANSEKVEPNVKADPVGTRHVIVIVVVDLRSSIEKEVHVWDPLLLKCDNKVPNAAHEMDVQEHAKDQVYNLQTSLDFLRVVQVHDNFTDPLHSQQLQQTKQLQHEATSHEVGNGHCRNDIDDEVGAKQVPLTDEDAVHNFLTRDRVDVSRPEPKDDISHKDQIDQWVKSFEARRVKDIWPECDIEWDRDRLVYGKYNDE